MHLDHEELLRRSYEDDVREVEKFVTGDTSSSGLLSRDSGDESHSDADDGTKEGKAEKHGDDGAGASPHGDDKQRRHKGDDKKKETDAKGLKARREQNATGTKKRKLRQRDFDRKNLEHEHRALLLAQPHEVGRARG